jgi:hypothetical protein
VRERANAEVDGVKTIRDEACSEFARPRNVSWMNACIGVANTGHTKVGTTMNKHHCLRGPAEKISEKVTMHRAARREDVHVVCCCWYTRSRVRVETATLVT